MSLATDILALEDKNTGVPVNYSITTEWIDGSPMTDAKTDGVMYNKLGVEYYKRNYENYINAKWFGVSTDNDDNSEEIKRAIAYLKSINGGTLYFQKGNYIILEQIEIDFDGLVILGDGSKNTVFEVYHSGTAFKYTSAVQDLSAARFSMNYCSVVNKVNSVSFPVSSMTGVGFHGVHMHANVWTDFYTQNFNTGVILEESYLNTFINHFAESNWKGLRTIGGSNGNIFYGGAFRNSAIDLRSAGCERNRFVGVDFEPASDTCYLGTNNFFDNCRFERFNLIHGEFSRTWLVLGDGNFVNECDFHYNFNDRPTGWMVIIEGENNKITFKKLNITSNILKFAETSKKNEVIFSHGFEDFEVTGSIKTAGIRFVDFGFGNIVTEKNDTNEIKLIDSFEYNVFGKKNNILPDNWNVTMNVDNVGLPANDLTVQLLDLNMSTDQRINKIVSYLPLGTPGARRIKSTVNIGTNNSDNLYSASVWCYIPSTTTFEYIGVGVQEGNLTYYDNRIEGGGIPRVPRDKWFLMQSTAIISTDPIFTMDFMSEIDEPVYIALASVTKGETFSIYE